MRRTTGQVSVGSMLSITLRQMLLLLRHASALIRQTKANAYAPQEFVVAKGSSWRTYRPFLNRQKGRNVRQDRDGQTVPLQCGSRFLADLLMNSSPIPDKHTESDKV